MNSSDPSEPTLGLNQTLVAVRPDGSIWASEARGIKPLLDALAAGIDLKGARCRDKIVGRAAAFLFVCAGVASVSAPVMAVGATRLFERYAIRWAADTTVGGIVNRASTGPCPMEQAVSGIDDGDPLAAQAVLRRELARRSGNPLT